METIFMALGVGAVLALIALAKTYVIRKKLNK